ncbi:SUKH-3 domain-containing protein [Embleya sp. NPDC005575]|uniref:SUKH-3 domain-containing protein n=1 Tax=Embleya sp. NPDC005575 TaxID=3156892 RepID=UPI0033AC32BE
MTRFSTDVVHELKRAGWTVGRRRLTQAEAWARQISDHESPDGHRHSVFPAALVAWAEFGTLHFAIGGAGKDVLRRPFTIDPTRGLHLPRTLTDVGRALGTPLAPLGDEDDGSSYLAIDPSGRVFGLDHTGEWFIGSSMDVAISTLVLGLAPVRIRDDGRW